MERLPEEVEEVVVFLTIGVADAQIGGGTAAPVCAKVHVASCRPEKALATSAFFAR